MLLILPADMVALLAPFAPLFSRPVWRHAHVVLVGAILPPGQRLVSSAPLRTPGCRAQPPVELSGLPSGVESCDLVEPERQSHLAWPAGGNLCARWAARTGQR